MKRIIAVLGLTLAAESGGAPVFEAQGSSARVDLPQSGQQACYDENGASISCAGSGQDGDIQAGIEVPDPRFVDHGDGTVTDLLTGLMWSKDRNCAATVGHDPAGLGTGQMSWLDALEFVALINDGSFAGCQAGYTDWRLPNINEILSIGTLAAVGPALSPGHPFLFDGGSNNFWSSTSKSGNGAWSMDLYAGLFRGAAKTRTYKAWPVRGSSGGTISLAETGQSGCSDENGDSISCAGSGQDGETQTGVSWPNPRFVDHADGTISDQLTGLMWQKNLNCADSADYDPEGTGDGSTTWQQALDFVAAVNAGTYPDCASGHNDWRLPNPLEMTSLLSPNEADLTTWLADIGFTNLVNDWTWTSSTYGPPPLAASAHICHPVGAFARAQKPETHPFWLVRTHLAAAPLFVDGFE